MKVFLTIIVFMMILTINLLGQENNPDRYTSLTLGAGITGTEQTFLMDIFPDHEWKRYVNVPNVFAKMIIPISDIISVIFDGNYAFKTNSNFDGRGTTTAPLNTIMQTYYTALSLKLYLK